MTEPVTSVLGVKLTSTLAGFAGGVVSLAFIQRLTRWQAICAVVVGALTASYFTPVVAVKIGLQQPEFVNCAAFVIGLCAMNIVPAVKAVVMKFTSQAESRFQPTQGDGGTQ